MELFAPLDPEKVDKLGREYNLPQSEIQRLQKGYQSSTQKMEAYLDLYVHQHPCPSWSKIADVLYWADLSQQASLVENTYIKGTHKTYCETGICILNNLQCRDMPSTYLGSHEREPMGTLPTFEIAILYSTKCCMTCGLSSILCNLHLVLCVASLTKFGLVQTVEYPIYNAYALLNYVRP